MSEQTDANNIGGESPGTEAILDRDDWTCQVCGHTPPEGSDEPMFVTQIGEDETNPDHFETRCSDCYDTDESVPSIDEADSDSYLSRRRSSKNDTALGRFTFQFLAMPIYLGGMFVGLYLLVGGLSVLNPLRMIGMSTWPVEIYSDAGAITYPIYINQVIVDATQLIAVGSIIIVVITQLTIWYEPKNGLVTRLTKWIISGFKNMLVRLS